MRFFTLTEFLRNSLYNALETTCHPSRMQPMRNLCVGVWACARCACDSRKYSEMTCYSCRTRTKTIGHCRILYRVSANTSLGWMFLRISDTCAIPVSRRASLVCAPWDRGFAWTGDDKRGIANPDAYCTYIWRGTSAIPSIWAGYHTVGIGTARGSCRRGTGILPHFLAVREHAWM